MSQEKLSYFLMNYQKKQNIKIHTEVKRKKRMGRKLKASIFNLLGNSNFKKRIKILFVSI